MTECNVKPTVLKVQTLGIGGIFIPQKRLRRLQPDKVDAFAESMRRSGLVHPIVVQPMAGGGYEIIAGVHRFKAAQQLKWATVPCIVKEGLSAAEAELIEIDENLIRAQLSPAEEALHILCRKELHEKLHPETKHGAIGRGRKKSSQDEKSFAEATAKAIGKGRSTVAKAAARAKNVVVLDQIVGTSLDVGEQIDALAKLPEDEQRQLAEQAKAGENVSAKKSKAEVKAPSDPEERKAYIKELEDKARKHLAAGDAKAAEAKAFFVNVAEAAKELGKPRDDCSPIMNMFNNFLVQVCVMAIAGHELRLVPVELTQEQRADTQEILREAVNVIAKVGMAIAGVDENQPQQEFWNSARDAANGNASPPLAPDDPGEMPDLLLRNGSAKSKKEISQ